MSMQPDNDDRYPKFNNPLMRTPNGLPLSWAHASGMDKLNAILSAPDPQALVQSMPTDDAYFLVHDIGVASALEILPLLSGDQWQGFIDLSGWDKDQINPRGFQEWLSACTAVGHDTAMKMVKSVEPEYLTTWIIKHAQIFDKDLDPDVIPDAYDVLPSPDGEYYIVIEVDHPMTQVILAALRTLYAADIDGARRILKACIHENASPLEETCFQFRVGRMADLGFPAFDDSIEVFASLNVATMREEIQAELTDASREAFVHSKDDPTPGLVLYGVNNTPFLSRVLDLIPEGATQDRIAQDFVHLSHRILIATRGEVAEIDAHRDMARLGYANVSIALEYLSEGDEALAAKILEGTWLGRIFQAGHSLLVGSQQKARRLLSRMGGDRPYTLLGPEEHDKLAGCKSFVPQRLSGYDAEGHPEYTYFASLAEREEFFALTGYADAVVAYFENRFGFSPEVLDQTEFTGLQEDARSHIRFSTLLLTAIGNQSVGNGFSLEPLSPASMDVFLAAVLEENDGKRIIRPAIRDLLSKMAEESATDKAGEANHLLVFVQGCLEELEEALSALPPGEAIDPRFFGELLLLREE